MSMMMSHRFDWLAALIFALLLIASPLSAPQAQTQAELDQNLQAFFVHYNGGRFDQALKLAETGLGMAEALHGPQSADVGIRLNNLGLVLREVGRYAEAEPIYKRSIAIFERAENAEHADAHLPVVNLAGLYWTQSRFTEAEPLFLRAIDKAKKTSGDEHASVALALNNLGLLYWSQGRFTEAEPRLKQALHIWEKSTGGKHPAIAQSLTNLSNLYQVQGRFADAEPLLRQSIAISRETGGEDHPDLAISLNNLGELLRAQGRQIEAEQIFRQGLAITEKAFGRRHINAAMTLNNIAELYRVAGRFQEAEPYYAESLSIREQLLGPQHLAVAQSLNNAALNAGGLNKNGEAEALLRRALAIMEKSVGTENLDIAATMHNLGLLAIAQARYDEAEAMLQRGLAIRLKLLGSSHPAVIQSHMGIAFLRDAQGRKEEADELRKRASLAPTWDVAEIPVLFASNRAYGMSDKGPQFGSEQVLDPQRIALGRAMLRAPKAEVVNRAERNAAAFGQLQNATGRQTSESALAINDVAILDDRASAFWPEARATLARASRFPRQAIVFVHGYNNSFDDAVRRAAMISFDLDFDGIVAAFAWPARGGMTAYVGDRERAQTAAPFLVAMLETIAEALPDVKVHIVSHSTGSEVVLTALDKLADRASGGGKRVLLGEIIFAHADVNTNRLAQVLPGLRKLGVRLTSYSSREDLAMRASDLIRMDGKRVGGAPVYFDGVDAIDISGLGTRFSLNHSVFVRNPQVFNDMARLMASGERPPHKRSPLFNEMKTAGGIHWEFRAPPQPKKK